MVFKLAKWISNSCHGFQVDKMNLKSRWRTYWQGGACHSRQPQEHKLPELHGLPSALHYTQPAHFYIRIRDQFCHAKIPPSGPRWISHLPANCRWHQSSSSSTLPQSQRAPCPHPWWSGCWLLQRDHNAKPRHFHLLLRCSCSKHAW